jgi:hypothetical protein
MENTKTLYHASMLHLLAQTKTFCDAFVLAKAAAEAHDPNNEQTADEMAEKTVVTITQMLCQQMALIPGMRHIFENVASALHPNL